MQYGDNSIIAQLGGPPDMRIPIRYALTYQPVCRASCELDFTTLKLLTFDVADEETFRCLAACKKAIRRTVSALRRQQCNRRPQALP